MELAVYMYDCIQIVLRVFHFGTPQIPLMESYCISDRHYLGNVDDF